MYSANVFLTLLLCIIITIFAVGRVQSNGDSTVMKTVNETEMFYYEIQPELFNWTNGIDAKFAYTPSLQNYPDLPPWIHYKFNSKNRHGYLYGTPPVSPLERQIRLDIIGLNKKTYQVTKQVIQLNIVQKFGFAKNEIRFKINNLNVEDMFQEEHIPRLLDIYKQTLWVDSKPNLYVTFLASASDLGQRLPLDPNDTDGVVVNIGSHSNFSTILYDLEKEISPLQKLNKCPKDFKRTSVERYFRLKGFNLDWCSFKLVELTNIKTIHTNNVKYETLNITYPEENNIWELMESLPYSQSSHDYTTNTFSIVFIIFVLGIISSIVVIRWYTKK
ncbi:Hypothetical protein CINCED_3A016265 [Cinara cedri]|uniref:Epsilon-sarcoglycan n=1 Tax=Cinara cedri TaxID=506608 RepID=A0A5E4M585_9HEMI|nr:Hypothetical protein CINCED_3A016265 [Cinara cedri]